MTFTITGDESSALASLARFGEAVKGTTDHVGGQFSMVTSALEDILAPITAIVGLLGGGALFGEAVKGAVEFSKEMGGLQRVMGGTYQQAITTAWAVKSIFGDVDTYEAAAAKLVKTLNKNEKAVLDMGVRTRDASGHFRDMNVLLPEVVQALNEYSAGADRDAVAQQIFGRSFKDMLKYAQLTPEVFEEARKAQEAYGIGLESQKRTTTEYRQSMEEVDKGLEALKIRLAVEVMPALTNLAHWLSSVGPGAVNLVAGALNGMVAIMSNTGGQVAALGITLWTLSPALAMLGGWIGTYIQQLPVLGQAINVFRMEMHLLALEGVTNIRAITTAIQGMTIAMLENPMTWVLVAIAGVAALAAAVDHWAGAHRRAMEQAKQDSDKTLQGISDQISASKKALDAERDLAAAKGSEDIARSKDRLKRATDELLRQYPEVKAYLVDEAGMNRSLAEAIKAANDEKLARNEIDRIYQEAELAQSERTIQKYQQWNDALKHQASSQKPGEMNDRVWALEQQRRQQEIEYNNKVIQQERNKQELGEANLKTLNETADRIEAIDKKGKLPPTADKESGVTKLKADLEAYKLMVEKKTEKDGHYMEFTKAQELEWLNSHIKSYGLLPKQMDDIYKEISGDERATLKQRHEAEVAEMKASMEYFKHDKEEQLQIAKNMETYAANPKEAQAAREKQEKINQEIRDRDRQIDDIRIQQKRDYQLADIDLEEQHNRQLEQLGLISASETIRRDRELKEQRYQLERDALIERRDLKNQDPVEAERINSQIKTLDTAHRKKMDELLHGLNMAGWGGVIKSSLAGAESAFSSFFESLLEKGKTAAQKWDALWKGIANSVLKALSDIAAKQLMEWGVEKARSVWKDAESARNKARNVADTAAAAQGAAQQEAINAGLTTQTVVQDTIQTESAETTMAARIYAWYSSLGPWAIPAAAATIAAVLVAIKAIAGREHGGPVEAGVPYIVGERRPEVFVPDVPGRIIPSLGEASRNLGANLAAHESQVSSLQLQAASFGRAGVANAQANPAGIVDLRGAVIAGESAESARIIGNLIRKSQIDYGRRRG